MSRWGVSDLRLVKRKGASCRELFPTEFFFSAKRCLQIPTFQNIILFLWENGWKSVFWNFMLTQIVIFLDWKMSMWKWKPILCNPMNCKVHEILQTRILEWVVFPFFRASSQPGDWTQVSCIAGRFFTSWATRGARTSLVTCYNILSVLCWECSHRQLQGYWSVLSLLAVSLSGFGASRPHWMS